MGNTSYVTTARIDDAAITGRTDTDSDTDSDTDYVGELSGSIFDGGPTQTSSPDMSRIRDVRETTDLFIFDTADFGVVDYPAMTEIRRVTQKVQVPGHLGLGTVEEDQTVETVVELAPAYTSGAISSLRLFGGNNLGHREKCNMQTPGQLGNDAVAVVRGVEFALPAGTATSWASCAWTLNVGCKSVAGTRIDQLEQVSASPLAIVFRYIFTSPVKVLARQNFDVSIERFGDLVPRGAARVTIRGTLVRDIT
jgi:hypothetical protein